MGSAPDGTASPNLSAEEIADRVGEDLREQFVERAHELYPDARRPVIKLVENGMTLAICASDVDELRQKVDKQKRLVDTLADIFHEQLGIDRAEVLAACEQTQLDEFMGANRSAHAHGRTRTDDDIIDNQGEIVSRAGEIVDRVDYDLRQNFVETAKTRYPDAEYPVHRFVVDAMWLAISDQDLTRHQDRIHEQHRRLNGIVDLIQNLTNK